MYQNKKLYRDEQNKVIGGVCKGLADYFEIDVTIVRAIFLLALILKGGGVLIYVVLMIVMPKKPWGFGAPVADHTVPPTQGATGEAFAHQPQQPYMPPRKSNTGVIAGALLIFFGVILLIDEFDFIPYWDFEHLWPIPLVAIGLVLVFTSINKKPSNPASSDPKPPIE